MADTSTVQTLIVGAMGGAITMAVKYAIDNSPSPTRPR